MAASGSTGRLPGNRAGKEGNMSRMARLGGREWAGGPPFLEAAGRGPPGGGGCAFPRVEARGSRPGTRHPRGGQGARDGEPEAFARADRGEDPRGDPSILRRGDGEEKKRRGGRGRGPGGRPGGRAVPALRRGPLRWWH